MKKIKLKNSDLTGYLISVNKNMAIIKINNKKIKTDISNIEYLIKVDENIIPSTSVKYLLNNPSINFNNQLMLRHKTKDEAMFELENFINDAHSYGINKITIVHGKQGGVLREAVHEYLRKCNLVESFNLGNYFEGQFGVTIAYIK